MRVSYKFLCLVNIYSVLETAGELQEDIRTGTEATKDQIWNVIGRITCKREDHHEGEERQVYFIYCSVLSI